MSDFPDNISVQLVRIEGKLDVTNERLGNVQNDVAELRREQSRHSDRLGILEAEKNRRDGERKGLGIGGKVFLSVASAIGGGSGVLALVELLK